MTTPTTDSADELAQYDPNANWQIHTVRLTFRMWEASATLETKVRGNCKGLSILESAIGDVESNAESIVLTYPNGDTLLHEPDSDDWLSRYCVRAEIVAVEPYGRTKD